MEPEQIAEVIFSVEKNIRYVGIIGLSPGHEVRLSRMRDGVNSLTPEHRDREFIRTIPETILDMCTSQGRDLGEIRYSLLCFRRLTLTFFRTQQYVVVISLEAGTFARPIFDRITHLLSLDR
jgi:hypothetical protein